MTAVLSVVILTKDEEARITRALESMRPLIGRIRLIVLDSWSTDATVERATEAWKKLGGAPADLMLLRRTWRGFTEARQFSIGLANTPWVLWVDADEWMSPRLAEELCLLPAEPSPADPVVVRVPRQSYFLGRAIRHGGWFPDRKARLAQSSRCEWRSGPKGADVHEDLFPKELPERWGLLKGTLEHEPFRDRKEQRDTNLRYSALLADGAARDWKARGRIKPPWLWICGRTLWKFGENYLLKAGFLDGVPGFWIAWGSAQSLFWRFRRMRQLLS